MKDFIAVRELFKDTIDSSFYFDSVSAEMARNKLKETIHDVNVPLIFVLGDPGVGKSHMIRLMHNATALRYSTVLVEHPFFNPQELFKILFEARAMRFEKSATAEQCLNALKEGYEGILCTVFIDEAQLLNDEQFDVISLLSQTELFQFVLAMHKKEGNALIQKKGSKIENKLIIEYGTLDEQEVLRYIQTLLMANTQGEVALMFSKRDAKAIAKYAKGNFRTIKKFIYTLMKLLDYAQKNGLTKYQKLNHCLLTMTALEIGLIHD